MAQQGFEDFPDQPGEDTSDFPDQPESLALPPVPKRLYGGVPERGWLETAWHEGVKPLTTLPSELARKQVEFEKSIWDYLSPELTRSRLAAQIKGFGEGGLEAMGDVASSLTSPINLATSMLFGAGGAAAKAGLPRLAQIATLGGRGLSVPVIGSGVQRLVTEGDPFGIAEVAGGLAGAITPTPRIGPRLPQIAEAVAAPKPPTLSEMGVPQVSSITLKKPTPALVARLKQEGFIEGGVDAQGRPRMVRGAAPTPEPTATPELTPLADETSITIPRPSMAIVDRMQKQGYKVGAINPDGSVQFVLAEEAPIIEDIEPQFSRGPVTNREMFELSKSLEQPAPTPEQPVLPPEFGPDVRAVEEPAPEQIGGYTPKFEEPQAMRVPGSENVAIGGASPRVLDVLGSSLYSRQRATTTVTELLQNAADEHQIVGSTQPIRVMFGNRSKNPRTKEASKSITVRDQGRGLGLKDLYTVLTDVGETGKAEVESASGGFGFAKAAPFLGGTFARVVSVVDEAGKRMRYTFEGTPGELKNQVVGVPIKKEVVGPDVPTGLEVSTWYGDDADFWSAKDHMKNMVKNSPKISGVEFAEGYRDILPADARAFLDKGDAGGISQKEVFKPDPPRQKQAALETPTANFDVYFDTPKRGTESGSYKLHILNKGLYVGSEFRSYGETLPGVPKEITIDIFPKVTEGGADYAFSLNREQINQKITDVLDTWIEQNVSSGALKTRVQELSNIYQGMPPIFPEASEIRPTVFYDEGQRFLPQEISVIQRSPAFQKAISTVHEISDELVAVADTLKWPLKPSERLEKFGVLFAAPTAGGELTWGIHLGNPANPSKSAILVNFMEILNSVQDMPDPIDRISSKIFATTTHEIAHIPGGGHDTSFAYRHADLLESLGTKMTKTWLDEIGQAFGESYADGTSAINPEISELLSIYNQSRGRAASIEDTLLRTGIGAKGPTNIPAGKRPNVTGIKAGGPESVSRLREAYNLPRGLTTSFDFSAPLRQGLPLISRKEWWTSLDDMIRAWGSEKAYSKIQAEIKSDPIFQRRINPKTGKIHHSFAEESGLQLTDLNKLSSREEALMSTWAEKVPGVRRSNRAYTAYLNKLRADTFKSLINDADTLGMSPRQDLVLSKQIADFVNTATGRGSLGALEKNTQLLSNVFFSPRLLASRVRMLNPGTYISANPFVRKQYLKSLLTVAGAWSVFSGLAAMGGADVSTDTNSSDFGKIKIGNTRLDPAAGFQQYLVAASRLLSGQVTPSSGRKEYTLGAGFQAPTRFDVGLDFLVNKTHPVVKFAVDLFRASEYVPFNVADRVAQMFVPLIIQDAMELYREDPNLLPLLAPVSLGMGTQTYERGRPEPTIIPEELDIQFTGGPITPQ